MAGFGTTTREKPTDKRVDGNKSRLEAALQIRDLDVELHVVPVELVIVVCQEVVSFQPEVLHDGVELVDQAFHSLELRPTGRKARRSGSSGQGGFEVAKVIEGISRNRQN